MSPVAFDTLKFTRRLKQAGIPNEQAEAEVDALSEVFSQVIDTQVATKEDIHRLECGQDASKTELKDDIYQVKEDIHAIKQDMIRLDSKIDGVDARLSAKINLVHWMVGFNLLLTSGILFILLGDS